MKPTLKAWQNLVAAARQAPVEGDATAPYGFSTRVVARAFAGEPDRVAPFAAFARFSWPALGVAVLVMTVTVAVNIKPVMNGIEDEVASMSEPVVDTGDSSV